MCSEYRMITLHIQNKKGLHARAASAFVKEADKYRAEIWVEKDGQRVSGHSIMGLMLPKLRKAWPILLTPSSFKNNFGPLFIFILLKSFKTPYI